jgi:hypothetical protein
MNPVLSSARRVTDISEHVKLNPNGIKRAAEQVSSVPSFILISFELFSPTVMRH